jgi:hypothetical protein
LRLGGGDGEAVSSGDAPSGDAAAWKQLIDKASGRAYYYNRQTKEKTWQRPAALGSDAPTLRSVPGCVGEVASGGGAVQLLVARPVKSDALTTAADILAGKHKTLPGHVAALLGPLQAPRPDGRLNAELLPIHPAPADLVPGAVVPPLIELDSLDDEAASPFPQ